MICAHCQEPLSDKRIALALPGCPSCAPTPAIVCDECFRKLGHAVGTERSEMIQRIRLALAESVGSA